MSFKVTDGSCFFQDIINHYKLQQGTKVSKREELEEPTFTNTVPEAV